MNRRYAGHLRRLFLFFLIGFRLVEGAAAEDLSSACPETDYELADEEVDPRLLRAVQAWNTASTNIQAQAVADRLLSLAHRQQGSEEARAWAIYNASCIYLRIGRYDSASKAIAGLPDDAGRPVAGVRRHLMRARLASALAAYPTLLTETTAGLQLVPLIEESALRTTVHARLLTLQGFALLMAGGSEAESLLVQALDLARTTGDRRVIAAAQNNLAAVRFVAGDDVGMLELLHQSLRNYQAAGDDHSTIATLLTLGGMYGRTGRFQTALQYLKQSKAMLRSGAHGAHEADVDSHLAYLHFVTGDTELAYEVLSRSLEHFDTVGDTWHAAGIRRHVATIQRERGNIADAVRLHKSSLAEIRRHKVAREEIRVLLELIEDELARSNVEGALEYSERAVALVEASDEVSGPEAARTLLLHSRALLADGRHGDSLAFLAAADALIEPNSYPPIVVAVKSALAQTHLSAGRVRDALPFIRRVLDDLDQTRTALEADRLGSRWTSAYGALHARWVGVLLDQFVKTGNRQWVDEALRRLDTHRFAQLRFENLRSESVAIHGAPGEFVATASLELSLTANRWAADPDNQALRAKYYALLHEVEAAQPAQISTDRYPWPGLDAIQAALSSDETVLYYLIDDDRLLLISVWSHDVRVDDIPDVRRLVHDIERFSASLRKRTRPPPGLRRSISERVFGPHAARFERRLLVVADGALNRLSFSALELPGKDGNWNWLVLRTSITLLTGLSGLTTSSPDAEAFAAELVIFANPDFSVGDDGRHKWTSSLDPLPASSREAASLAAAASHLEPVVHTGVDATEDAFLSQRTRKSRVVHVATHGLYLPQHPEVVGLAFSPTNGLDGLLSPAEIRGVRFAAELVVLSACDSGSGLLLEGDGTMSMAKALLASGATASLSTHWQIADHATARLMSRFYEELLARVPAAEALRRAKVEMLNNRRYRDPYYWAPFELMAVRSVPEFPWKR